MHQYTPLSGRSTGSILLTKKIASFQIKTAAEATCYLQNCFELVESPVVCLIQMSARSLVTPLAERNPAAFWRGYAMFRNVSWFGCFFSAVRDCVNSRAVVLNEKLDCTSRITQCIGILPA